MCVCVCVCVFVYTYTHTHIFFRDAGQAKETKGEGGGGQQWITRAKEMFTTALLGTRAIGSTALF